MSVHFIADNMKEAAHWAERMRLNRRDWVFVTRAGGTGGMIG